MKYASPLLAICAAGVIGASVMAANAHGGATGIVKERMDQMVVLRDAIKVLKGQLAFGGAYDATVVIAAARDIQAHSGEALTAKFPQGSLSAQSEALPSVWTEWERFAELSMQLQSYAVALETAALNAVPNAHDGGMMMGGGMSGGGMMMGGAGPDAEHLAQMPPMASFGHIAETCTACHTDFRKKKEY